MARLTDDQRQQVMAGFHAGVSQNELAKRFEVSPATINKLCKGIEPKNIEKVNTLTRINTELAEQSEYEVNAIHSEVEERTKYTVFFNRQAVKNVQEAMETPCITQHDFKARADTIRQGKEVVLGKAPETAIQINNEQPISRVVREIVRLDH